MPPKKKTPVDTRPPEEVWLDHQKRMINTIKILRQAQAARTKEIADLESLRQLHVIEVEKLQVDLTRTDDESSDSEVSEGLKDLRQHQRWVNHYQDKICKLRRQNELDHHTVRYTLGRLGDEPYPGEEPLQETTHDPIEAGDTSRADDAVARPTSPE